MSSTESCNLRVLRLGLDFVCGVVSSASTSANCILLTAAQSRPIVSVHPREARHTTSKIRRPRLFGWEPIIVPRSDGVEVVRRVEQYNAES
jgi:hypothetical protein